MNEVKNHVIGPRYGTMGDEVTDTSDNVWLGLVLHYTIGNDVVEQLYQYVDCKSITGNQFVKLSQYWSLHNFQYQIHCVESVSIQVILVCFFPHSG